MAVWLAANAWLAVAAPLVLGVLTGALGRRLGRAVSLPALLAGAVALAVGAASASRLTAGAAPAIGAVRWLAVGPVAVDAGWAVDGLSALMLVIVGVVSLAVVLFSVGYMHGERGLPRYFGVLALFVAAMSGLVMAGSLVALVIGWELVGACSYLLIGFWYEKPKAADAALKAFLVTHVGDAGLLLGLAVLWNATDSLSIADVLARVPALPAGTVTAAALLLLLGAVGKSAQFPLHFWLPDAMEGPTPVSALIHAATMVAAGVFLLTRMRVLFEHSAVAGGVVLAVGTVTALGAAVVAVAQTDIKKVLAYSTISQLGFMFAALGAGAWGAAMFHLTTHAAFKALLFLCAGSVIRATGTQELAEMGGLARRMPVTAAAWVAGALALAGIPPLAGFFSKDAVIAEVLHASPVAGVALLLASLLTAFYIARATRLAFFGASRLELSVHEGGPAMTVPLAGLAVAAVSLGFLSGPVARLLGGEALPLETPLATLVTLLAVAGGAAGGILYRRGPAADDVLARRLGPVWRAACAAYGYDAAVMRFVVRPVVAGARRLHDAVDRDRFDGLAEGVGSASVWAGRRLARLQNGEAQWYAALIGAGVIVLIAATFLLGR